MDNDTLDYLLQVWSILSSAILCLGNQVNPKSNILVSLVVAEKRAVGVKSWWFVLEMWGKSLETSWREWACQEVFKRHCLICFDVIWKMLQFTNQFLDTGQREEFVQKVSKKLKTWGNTDC